MLQMDGPAQQCVIPRLPYATSDVPGWHWHWPSINASAWQSAASSLVTGSGGLSGSPCEVLERFGLGKLLCCGCSVLATESHVHVIVVVVTGVLCFTHGWVLTAF